MIGLKTSDVDQVARAIEKGGATLIKAPYDDLHERRAVAIDSSGNGLVVFGPLPG